MQYDTDLLKSPSTWDLYLEKPLRRSHQPSNKDNKNWDLKKWLRAKSAISIYHWKLRILINWLIKTWVSIFLKWSCSNQQWLSTVSSITLFHRVWQAVSFSQSVGKARMVNSSWIHRAVKEAAAFFVMVVVVAGLWWCVVLLWRVHKIIIITTLIPIRGVDRVRTHITGELKRNIIIAGNQSSFC